MANTSTAGTAVAGIGVGLGGMRRAGSIGAWLGYALLLVLAPLVLTSSVAHSVQCQIGIGIILCLSYNMLLGQGGMLSFGHAVYSGLGAFLAIHTLARVAEGGFMVPVSLLPLLGGFGAALCALLVGFVITRKSGIPFAMITLGIGELVWSMSLMFPSFFGGEGGVSANRVVGPSLFGVTWGSQVQLYYLIAAYAFASTALMYAFTRTPLGQMLNAVRDNPERVDFIGYDSRRVRHFAFTVSAFFAGVAGGLTALHAEMVTAEVLGTWRSGLVLVFTFLGGVGFFHGPIIGAVLMVLATMLLSDFTRAWQLYMGIAFLLMVLYAPGGVASLVALHRRVFASGEWRLLALPYLAAVLTALCALLGIGALVEMTYYVQMGAASGPTLRFAGLLLDTAQPSNWLAALMLFVVAGGLFEASRRFLQARWTRAAQAGRGSSGGGARAS